MSAALTTRPRLNAIVFAMLLEELMSGPSTFQTLCDVTGLERKTVRKVVKALYDRKLAHRSGFENDSRGRAIVSVWSFGPGRDAPRKPKTQAEICRAFRRRKALGEVTSALAGVAA